MLYPSRMKKATLLAHSDFIFPLTRELHRSGIMQIDPLEEDDLESCSPDRSQVEDISSRVEKVFETIHYEEEEDIKEMILNPKPPEVFEVHEQTFDELLSHSETILEPIEKEIQGLETRKSRLRERSIRLEERHLDLSPLTGLEFDVSLLGAGEFVTVMAGSTRDLDGLLAMLESDLVHVYHEGMKGGFSVVIIAHESQVYLVEKARRQRYFDAIDVDLASFTSPLTNVHSSNGSISLDSSNESISSDSSNESISSDSSKVPDSSESLDESASSELSDEPVYSDSSEESTSSDFHDEPMTDDSPGEPVCIGCPRDIIREIDTELLSIRSELKEIDESFRTLYAMNRTEILILREEISILLDNYQIFDRFAGTKTSVALTGWFEADRESELEQLCHDATEGHGVVMVEEPEGNEAPSLLRNEPWARPFEPLVHMFSTPKYNELDISMIVGPLFIIFFGLMLGDAGYGLVLIAMALFVLKIHAPHSEEIRDYGYFILLMGISTIIFGLIMGGVFYDSIQRFVYGDETLLLYPEVNLIFVSLPMDPMNDPTTIFLASLIVGLLTLNLGVLLGAYHHLKQKDYHSLVTGDLSWLILEPGGILLIGYGMFDAFALGSVEIMICVVTALIGLVLRIIHSKGLVMFDFTGFVGNVLSFARILALALATAGLALAINYFSQLMIDIHLALIIVGLLLFIVAHFINTLLQALGAGIHSLRLNYVEFFSMFYEGGGKQFDAFHIERTYTQVVEKEANQ